MQPRRRRAPLRAWWLASAGGGTPRGFWKMPPKRTVGWSARYPPSAPSN